MKKQTKIKLVGTIDPEVLVNELVESWINGNKNDVITALSHDHPGLTAMVLTAGGLSSSDRNEITNRLIDIRRELVKSSEQKW